MSRSQKHIPPHARMVFKGVIFEVWQWDQEMFDGSTETFEALKRSDAVQIISVVGDTVMIQVQEQPDSPEPFLSVPGGRRDEGEEPLQAAKRELLEETGHVSEDWELWQENAPSRKIEWVIHTYIARNCTKRQEPHLDAGEKITLRFLSFDDFLGVADDPSFRSRDIVEHLLRARFDTKVREELHQRLFGKKN